MLPFLMSPSQWRTIIETNVDLPSMICNKISVKMQFFFYTPHFNEVERGVYWYHLVRLSVCPSVRLSVRLSFCGQNRVRSVSSTILIGSISYLHILASNFRRCVACNARFEIQKFCNFGEFLKFVTLTLTSFDLDPIWLNGMGNHEAVGGILRTQAF